MLHRVCCQKSGAVIACFREFSTHISHKKFWKMLKKVPLVVILGSTGTGKTKLSLELAKKFGGEIISADSMQVYKGLNIATAKATKAEQQVAPHHLLDVAQPGVPYSVLDFRNSAHPIMICWHKIKCQLSSVGRITTLKVYCGRCSLYHHKRHHLQVGQKGNWLIVTVNQMMYFT
uniref:Uncharacterized protein n=1 Tax=Lutzomyia longipalpis TaxID=7200 RepID=A0A1B0FV03_LUTLO